MRRAALIALALVVGRASAQMPGTRPVEVRADAIVAHRATTTHLSLGLTRRASRNLELAVVAGGGVTLRDERDDASASGRADLLARFAPGSIDRRRWSAYAAGGVSALVERGASGRGVLALIVGVRGQRALVEAGLGGGLRLGAGVRF